MTALIKKGLLYILILNLAFPSAASARKAGFADVLITENRGEITLYARVTDCFTRDMERAILSGVPTTFTFFIELYQDVPYLWDKKLVSKTVKHTVKFDSIKKIFLFTTTRKKGSEQFTNFEHAKRAMSELNGVNLIPVSALKQGNSYYVRMKAKLDKIHLPWGLESVLFFVSLWDFETNWYEQRVNYP